MPTPRVAKRVEEIKRQAFYRAKQAERTKSFGHFLVALGLIFWVALPITLLLFQVIHFQASGLWHWFNIIEVLQILGARNFGVPIFSWEPLRDAVYFLMLGAWAGSPPIIFGIVLHIWGQVVREDAKSKMTIARREAKLAERRALSDLALDIRERAGTTIIRDV